MRTFITIILAVSIFSSCTNHPQDVIQLENDILQELMRHEAFGAFTLPAPCPGVKCEERQTLVQLPGYCTCIDLNPKRKIDKLPEALAWMNGYKKFDAKDRALIAASKFDYIATICDTRPEVCAALVIAPAVSDCSPLQELSCITKALGSNYPHDVDKVNAVNKCFCWNPERG